MHYILVRYQVRDYARWRAVFDADTVDQRRADVFVRHVLHDEKNPNHITLIAHVEDRTGPIALSRRKNLDELIEKAGLLRDTIRYRWLGEQ
jgi:hypothetical protein